MSNEDWNELDESYRSALSGALETAHPAVEQAGGDERAAFEAYRDRRNALLESEGHNPGSKWHVTNAHYPTWEASRAALAQPSPAQAEQAEPERPEVVAWQYRVTAGPQTGWSLWHPGKGEEFERSYTVERRPLMTVAQYDRIVGELRADRDSWAKRWDEAVRYGARIEEQRDAALARVAKLEAKLGPALGLLRESRGFVDCDNPLNESGQIKLLEEIDAFLTSPVAQAQHSVPGKYDDVLLPFLKSMEHELHANAGKGDRPGWLQMDRRTALLEIYYHLAKLQKATKDNDAAGIVEYAADVANMSMMLVDVCGLLAAAPRKEGV